MKPEMEQLKTRNEFGSKIYGKLVKQYPQLVCEGGSAQKSKNRRRNKKNQKQPQRPTTIRGGEENLFSRKSTKFLIYGRRLFMRTLGLT